MIKIYRIIKYQKNINMIKIYRIIKYQKNIKKKTKFLLLSWVHNESYGSIINESSKWEGWVFGGQFNEIQKGRVHLNN